MIILWTATQAQRDHEIIHARNFRVQPQATMGSSIVEYASERLCLGHPFLKHHEVREIQRRRSSLVGKSAQTSAECIN